MARLPWLLVLMLLVVPLVSGGATCARRQAIPEFAPPVLFQETPTLAQLSEQINRSLAIERLESHTMSIASPEVMTNLSGTLAWERPHNFSLQAYPVSRLLGMAFAAGSNADMFWLQRQIPSPPTLYYARHDDFENQPGPRWMLPVSPLWLREALGVAELDPALQHNGPTPRPDGKLEIETFIPSPRGAYRRVLIVDANKATIEQTVLYDHHNQMVANALQSEHQYYSAIDWSLPHRVDIQLKPDQGPPLAFTIEVQFYLINESGSTDSNQFAPPDPTGLSTYNLAAGSSGEIPTAPAPPVYTQARPQGQHSGLAGYRVVR